MTHALRRLLLAGLVLAPLPAAAQSLVGGTVLPTGSVPPYNVNSTAPFIVNQGSLGLRIAVVENTTDFATGQKQDVGNGYALTTSQNTTVIAAATGTTSDAGYGGTGTGTLIALLKGQYGLASRVQGSPSGGTAATYSGLVGGIYRATLPSLTDGQQAGFRLDATGALVSASASTTATGSNSPVAQPVQGAGPTAVPLNTFAGQYNATLPTVASGSFGPLALDSNGRLIQAPGFALDATITARLGTLGQKTMANSAPVVIASDNGLSTAANQASEIAALGTPSDAAYAGSGSSSIVAALKGLYTALIAPTPAGTNVIGKVGIDQTTNGTSNGVYVLNQAYQPAGTNAGYGGAMQGVVNGLGFQIAPSNLAANAIAPTVARAATVLTGKASAGNLFGYSLTQGTTAGFFAFLDLAAAPATGASITPVECVAVPAGGYVARRQDIADRYANGIQVVSTSSCTTYTAVTPVQMSVSVQ